MSNLLGRLAVVNILSLAAANCFDESDWTGSFVREKWPANKDTMHITPTVKGFDITVDRSCVPTRPPALPRALN